MGSAGLVLSNLARFLFPVPLSLWLKTSGGKWAPPERAQPQPTLPPTPEILSPSAHLRLFAVETACGAAPRELVGRAQFTMEPPGLVPILTPRSERGTWAGAPPGRTESAVNCRLLGREG